jgi:iron complex outermembrane receptor protein
MRLLCFVAFWFLSGSALAQGPPCHCTVRGTVTERGTQVPVVGATVFIKNGVQHATTDVRGVYEVKNLCQGTYTLVCRLVGYEAVEVPIQLTHDELEQDVLLAEADIHLQDVVVTAQRTGTPPQPRAILDGAALEQTRGQTLGEALQAIPGVTVLQTGSTLAKPIIHGLHSSRIVLLNNGIRQEGQQWGSEHAPEIDPFMASKLVVVKGAAGVRYGADALGGVVLVEPADLPREAPLRGAVHAVGRSNGRQVATSARLEGGVTRWPGLAWRVQGTWRRGGNLQTPDYFLDNTGLREINGAAALGYRRGRWTWEGYLSQFTTQIGLFTGSHVGNLTDLQTVLRRGEPLVRSAFSYAIGRPYQDVTHRLQKLSAVYRPARGGQWSFTLARQANDRAEYDLHRPRNDSLAALNRPELLFRLQTYTADVVWEHPPVGKRLTGTAGLSAMYQRNRMSGRPLIPNFRQVTLGAFLIEKYTAGAWELEAGLRYDVRHLGVSRFVRRGVIEYPEYTYTNLSGTLGAIYTFAEGWTTRLHAGTAWRPPNANELYTAGVHHGAAAYEEGDPTLRPETAYNTSWTTTYTGKRLTGEVSLYHNYIAGFIYLKPQAAPVLTIRGAFPAFRYTQVDAVFRGVDFSAQYALTPRLTWQGKYALVRARDVRNDAYLVQIPADRAENSLRYTLKPPGRWEKMAVHLGQQYVARQRRAPENGDYLPPPPAYWLWEAGVEGRVPVGERYLDIGLSATNLLNTDYRDYLNRFRYYADEIGRNVTLRLRYSF